MENEVSLLVFSSASLNLAVDMLAWINEWAKEQGYANVFIRNVGMK